MPFVRHVPVTFQEEEASVLPAMFVAFCRDSGGVTMNLRGSYPPPSLVPSARMDKPLVSLNAIIAKDDIKTRYKVVVHAKFHETFGLRLLALRSERHPPLSKRGDLSRNTTQTSASSCTPNDCDSSLECRFGEEQDIVSRSTCRLIFLH